MSEQLQNAKVIIGLIDPKSPSNVGAVMRAAGCYNADAVVYTGERYDRAARFHTDTKNAVNNIPLQQVDDLALLKIVGRKLICVDLVEGAIALPKFTHPENAVYVFGSEDSSVSQALVDVADAVVYVPTVGCMNLAASVNVLLYDRLAKNRNTVYSDTVIKENRDRNNKVKVKS
jgi:tRNA(Leu) C34 or U34 (ribose-2'-O)-methylase TrmL